MVNGKAIAAVILGIISTVTVIFGGLGIIFGLIGLIIGVIGLKEINRFKQEGRKMAITGIVFSSIGIILPIILIVISYMVFIPHSN